MRWTSVLSRLNDISLRRYYARKVWHKWFAWYPIRIGDQTVWLEIIERRWHIGSYSNYWRYQLIESNNDTE